VLLNRRARADPRSSFDVLAAIVKWWDEAKEGGQILSHHGLTSAVFTP